MVFPESLGKFNLINRFILPYESVTGDVEVPLLSKTEIEVMTASKKVPDT